MFDTIMSNLFDILAVILFGCMLIVTPNIKDGQKENKFKKFIILALSFSMIVYKCHLWIERI